MRRVLLLLLLLPTSALALGYDNIEILAVGITTYKDGAACPNGAEAPDGKWCNLPNGHFDAKALGIALKARTWLKKPHVTVLSERRSTRMGILGALRKAAIEAKKGNSLLVFYFTGHGMTRGDAGFIIPSDADTSNPDTWLSMAKVKALLREHNAVQHQLVILGSCFSGQVFRGSPLLDRLVKALPEYATATTDFIDYELKKSARVALTAGRKDERVPDGKPRLGSPFGRALATAFVNLNGAPHMAADANQDHCVSHLELAGWLHTNGSSPGGTSGEGNTPQIGTLGAQSEAGHGTILFCERGAGVAAKPKPNAKPGPKRGPAPKFTPPAPAPSVTHQPGDRVAAATTNRPALRHIPAGSFTMGSPASEAGRDDDETQHAVTLSAPFWMMQTEVTQAQYKAVVGAAPSHFSACGQPAPSKRSAGLMP